MLWLLRRDQATQDHGREARGSPGRSAPARPVGTSGWHLRAAFSKTERSDGLATPHEPRVPGVQPMLRLPGDLLRLLRLRSSCCGLQARRTEPPERWVREAAAAVAAAPFFRCRRNGC